MEPPVGVAPTRSLYKRNPQTVAERQKWSQSPVLPRTRLAYDACLNAGSTAALAVESKIIWLRIVLLNDTFRPLIIKTIDSKPRFRGAIAGFVERCLSEGKACFSMADALASTGLSHSAAKQQILRLKQVVRVSGRHDFFLILSPEDLPMGSPAAVKWLDAYFRWLRQPYYLALLSAAAIHASQPHAVQMVQVMIQGKRRPLEIGRLKLQFYQKTIGIEKVPVIQPSGYPAVVRVSSPEATALDLLRYSERIGGYSRSEETILPMAKLFKVDRLGAALDANDEPALGQRLGFMLEKAGHVKLATAVHRWLSDSVQWTFLEPGASSKAGEKIQRWKLIKNT